VAAAQAVGDVFDERWLGVVGMNAEGFGRQLLAPRKGGVPHTFTCKVFD
jgi:hypothetical protein